MNKKSFIVLMIFILAAVFCGAAYAEGPYTFELTEANTYSDEGGDWYLKVSVPQISGMADEEEQKELNDFFADSTAGMIDEYKRDVEYAKASREEGNTPHFGYEYFFDVVTDTDEYFVFRTTFLTIAGSSMSINEYYTLSKISGELVDFDDVVTSEEEMLAIRDYIFSEMSRMNESGEGIYWLEDDALDNSLGMVEYTKHWYINAYGNLVITFDKYEIAPGAMGTSEFVISRETAAAGK